VLLHVRLRLRWPPLAGGAPWSPTRDHGPCEARAKELRLSLGDDAHQEEQHARLADRLLVRILRSQYAASCFAWRGWLRSAKGTCGGNTAAPSSWPSWASTFLPASSQLPGRALRHRRAAPTPSSAQSSSSFISASSAWSHGAPRWTRGKTFAAFHRPLHHARSFCVGRGEFFFVEIIRTLTPRSGPPWSMAYPTHPRPNTHSLYHHK